MAFAISAESGMSGFLLLGGFCAAIFIALPFVVRRFAIASSLNLVKIIAAIDRSDTESENRDDGGTSKSSQQSAQKLPMIGSVSGIIIGCICGIISPDIAVGAIVIGLSLGYIVGRVLLNRAVPDEQKAILFHLPMNLEKLLIAIQSGLDVVPALKISCAETGPINPASRAFRRVVQLIEQGATVEGALEQVAADVQSVPLKHVLLHLKVAHNRGGDLTFPLRELADATQVTYEQAVDEEIAVLPIKATAPLLCTFLGLLIVFLTGPIMGVIQASSSGSQGMATSKFHSSDEGK